MGKRRVSMTLDEELVEEIDEEAEESGMNRSEMVSRMAREFLESSRVTSAVVFCGDDRCLEEYEGEPVLQQTVRNLEENRVEEIYVLTPLAEKIKREVLFEESMPYFVEDSGKGTAAALREVEGRLESDFAVLNGHVYAGVDVQEMHEFHKQQDRTATMALKPVQEPSRYGVASLKGSRITGFVHRPEEGEAPSRLINAGFYVFSPEIFEKLGDNDLDRVFEKLAENGQLSGYVYDSDWREAEA